jgi:hypothetical protein
LSFRVSVLEQNESISPDYIIAVSGNSSWPTALQRAWNDSIGILLPANGDTDIIIPENGGNFLRDDGKMLRFFYNASTTSAVYNVVDSGTLFTIRGREAYTMVWRSDSGSLKGGGWVIVPGIVRPKPFDPNEPLIPLPPAAPTGLTATNDNNEAQLNYFFQWTEPFGTIDNYTVTYTLDNDPDGPIEETVSGPSLLVTPRKTIPSTTDTYNSGSFFVTATNEAGTSVPSETLFWSLA